MQNSILVKNLSKSYGTYTAIDNISFQVKKGEIFAFLGPNGAGKSTTIAILSTLLPYYEGSVEMEGYVLGRQNEAIRKELGIVFQGSMLDDSLSVEENLKLRCGLYNIFGKQANERTKLLVGLCQLQDLLHQKVKNLSGGQRRKVDIARALIPSPSILILDEPSTGLDPKSRKDLWTLIKNLHLKENMTIFMTTHYMEETEIADHICILHEGHILVDGNRLELQKSFQKDHLHLYTDVIRNLSHELNKKKWKHTCYQNYIDVEILNFYQLMSILRNTEHFINHIELKKGSLEDMYLTIIEEEEA